MKRVTCLLLVLYIFSACNKRTHPTVNRTNTRPAQPTADNRDTNRSNVFVPENSAPPLSPTARAYPDPMIVIDEGGHVITSRERLPDIIAAKVDYRRITRAFTPEQRKNLIYRFKMVPPRVIYVPDNLVRTSAKGTYCIFKKKFWYWKKEDGLFYLDETYYQ